MSKSAIADDRDTQRAAPEDVIVQINLRVPYHYRETLIAVAKRDRRSLNRTLVNALVQIIPPER